jgi:DNA-binding transcriptional LysR family regulator
MTQVFPMTLVQLRHLISLAETGSFTRSAQALFLTQPALSRSIRALEEELGQPLFDRIGRRSLLTPFGEEALQRARQLVADAEDLARSGRQMESGQTGVIRVGLGAGPGAMLMTPLLRTMAQSHPKVHVDITRGDTDKLVTALRERELDALVVDARALLPAPDLQVSHLVEMRGAFMVRQGHPLTQAKGPVRFTAVRQFPIASTPLSDEVARTLVERYGAEAHPWACVTLRCGEISSLVQVAQDSDAVLIAIRAAAPDLVELTLKPALNATARFGVVTLARRAEPPALAILRKLVAHLMSDCCESGGTHAIQGAPVA